MRNNDDLADKEMLRSFCPQVIQLRKTHQDDDVYQILIENISNRALKTNLLNVLASVGPTVGDREIEPIATAEIVNGQLTWARLYRTSSWMHVKTVLLLSVEKEALSILAQGEIVEQEIYSDLETIVLIHQWPVPAPDQTPVTPSKTIEKRAQALLENPPTRSWITLSSGKRQAIGGTSAAKRIHPTSPKPSEDAPDSPAPQEKTNEPPSSSSPTTPGTTCPTTTSSSWSTAKGSFIRNLTRIGQYLGLTTSELTHLKTTLQMIQNMEQALMYLAKYGLSLLYPSSKFWFDQLAKMYDFPTDTMADCLNIIQARRSMNKPDYSNKRAALTDWIESTLRERCRPPYSWQRFQKVLSTQEHKTLLQDLGTSHKSYCNDVILMLNNETMRNLPEHVEDQLAFESAYILHGNRYLPEKYWLDVLPAANGYMAQTLFAKQPLPTCRLNRWEAMDSANVTAIHGGGSFSFDVPIHQPLAGHANFIKPILNSYATLNQGTYTNFTWLPHRNKMFNTAAQATDSYGRALQDAPSWCNFNGYKHLGMPGPSRDFANPAHLIWFPQINKAGEDTSKKGQSSGNLVPFFDIYG